jgi:TRAP transporter TAXI family solute receptor
MRKRLATALVCAAFLVQSGTPYAQEVTRPQTEQATSQQRSSATPRTRTPFNSPAHLSARAKRELEAYRDKVNEGIVGIVAGGIEGTYLRVATELATVLDETDGGLRVLPIAGKGSLRNIWDIVFARGVDAGLVQSDVLAYAKRENIFPAIGSFIQYIAHLYDEEVHVLARPNIQKIEDLAFKKVNFDGRGSGTYMTANVVFNALGFPVSATTFDQALALEKLKQGEIDALVYVAGKPAALFSKLRPEDNLHFLSIPITPELQQIYSPTRLTSEEYPQLVQEGTPIDTIAVGAVLAVYAWTPEHERYHKVGRFVNAFFSRAAVLQNAPRHPKWRELSLAAPLPGWTRFPPAQAWLKNAALASRDPHSREDFETFLTQVMPGGGTTPEQRDILFAEYQQWRGQRVAEATAGSTRPASEVKKIQSALRDRGLYNGPIDGIAGPATERAIADYRQRYGLPQTAALDLETLQSLAADGGGGRPESGEVAR